MHNVPSPFGGRQPRLPSPGPRMEVILSLVRPCNRAAEVGADHGILSAHLLKRGTVGEMVVSDISAPSLEKARQLLAFHGLAKRASFQVADGLSALSAPVNAVLIAGMGGATICQILTAGREKLGGADLILQANTNIPMLRAHLVAFGYGIGGERLCREGRRYYVAIRAEVGADPPGPHDIILGPCLRKERPPLWADYLRWRRDCLLRQRDGDAEELTIIEKERNGL